MYRIGFVVVLMCVGGSLAAFADDTSVQWTGWLGPNRDGWVKHFQPPARWPKKLTRVWKVDVGGGYGTPVVIGDRVFQHARQGDNEVVHCIDLKTGQEIWRKAEPVPFKSGGGGEYHGKGPKSCPVLADGKLFTLSITGVVTARNAKTGERLWQKDYGRQFPTSKRPYPNWGATTSPIVDDGKLIVRLGPDDQGILLALNVESGDEIWSQKGHGPSYASPLLETIGGVRQVVEWNHETLAGVDIANGKTLWETPFPHVGTDQNMPTPTLYNGRILLGAENRGLHCYEPSLKDGKWSVKKIWQKREVALDMSTAVINDGLLYGLSHFGRGRLFCVDPKDGKLLWQGPARTGENVTFLAIPNHLIALINNGQLKVIAAKGKQSHEVASYKVSDDATWAPPVLLRDSILIKDRQSLALWSLKP